jgi:hypothetical protein
MNFWLERQTPTIRERVWIEKSFDSRLQCLTLNLWPDLNIYAPP